MSTPADSGATSFQIDLSGRTAMVTGAASGIGAACAVRLAAAGAHVIAVDRDEAGLAELAAGTDIEPLPCDLADLDASAPCRPRSTSWSTTPASSTSPRSRTSRRSGSTSSCG